MKLAIPALNEEGPQRLLHSGDDDLIVLERRHGKQRADRVRIIVRIASRSRPRELKTWTGRPGC